MLEFPKYFFSILQSFTPTGYFLAGSALKQFALATVPFILILYLETDDASALINMYKQQSCYFALFNALITILVMWE